MTKIEILHDLLRAFENDKSAAIKAIQDYPAIMPLSKKTSNVNADNVAIALRSVCKTYELKGRTIGVLKNISLDIYEGEFVAITGVSGSGKSTLLQLMGGLDKPTSGVVEINKQDISRLSDSKLAQLRNSTVGFIFQFFYLQPFLNLERNIEVAGMFGRSERVNRRTHINELLHVVGLADLRDHYPRQLSGGQLQRAAISRALLNKPKIILADEPTGNLDSKNSEAIIEIFETMRKQYNVTIILVTHDNEIARRADRILSINDGEIL